MANSKCISRRSVKVFHRIYVLKSDASLSREAIASWLLSLSVRSLSKPSHSLICAQKDVPRNKLRLHKWQLLEIELPKIRYLALNLAP